MGGRRASSVAVGGGAWRLRAAGLVGGVVLSVGVAVASNSGLEILAPAAGAPVFGSEAISFRSPSAPVDHYEVWVDGALIARVNAAATASAAETVNVGFDFGESGREREIVVRARLVDGQVLVARRKTRALRIDEVVDLDLHQVYATVLDRRGRRITDLEQRHVRVWDAEVEQEIVTFRPGDVAFTASILVDVSTSMLGQRLDAALDAARGFVSGMRSWDQAAVVGFSDRETWIGQPVESGAAAQQLDQLQGATREGAVGGGGTAVRDALFAALTRLESRHGRRVVVMLTDGWDRASALDSEILRGAVRRSRASIYWVRLAGDQPTSAHRRAGSSASRADLRSGRGEFRAFRYHPAPSSWRSEDESRDDWRSLQRLVETSGGRVVEAENASGLAVAMNDVLDELHDQVAIGYYRQDSEPRDGRASSSPRAAQDESWREIVVEVTSPGRRLRVRTRAGYVDH